MTTVYIPRPIRTVEDTEGLPEGTRWIVHEDYLYTRNRQGEWWTDDSIGGKQLYIYKGEPATALVPVEATEVYGARDKAGAVSRADAGTADPRAQLEKHIAERRALGHPDTLVSRPVLPWEAVEEA